MASSDTVRIADQNAKQYAKLTRQWASLNIDRDANSPAGGHPLIRRWFQLRDLAIKVERDLQRLEADVDDLDPKDRARVMTSIAGLRGKLLTLEKQKTDLLVSIQDKVDGINKVLLDKVLQYRELMRKGAFPVEGEDEQPSEDDLRGAAIDLLQELGYCVIEDPSDPE